MNGYIRVSDVAGREGERYGSPRLQEKAIKEAAKRSGVKLGQIVTEEDVSGAKRPEERGLDAVRQSLENGRPGIVAAVGYCWGCHW